MSQSSKYFEEAQNLMPGGVNSPVRAFKGVGGTPIFFKSANGSKLVDVDDNQYIDFVGSWGTALVGHAHPQVVRKVQEAASLGLSFGAPTPGESELVKMIRELVPSMQMVRLVNSGTEACMSALRLARAFSKRNKFIKFSGCYHGHHDAFLIQAGSGVATLAIPDCPGVTEGVAKDTIICRYNDPDNFYDMVQRHKSELGTVILEPFIGNSGFIRPTQDFINCIKEVSEKFELVIIFDEVMTGFRVARGGAQELLGLRPHLTTLGKVIGGGLPIGAYGGDSQIMKWIAPEGPVYQAGTLSGNPVAVAAGRATLEIVKQIDYNKLHSISEKLVIGLKEQASKFNVPFSVDCQGAMFGVFISEQLPKSYEDVKKSNILAFKSFFHSLLHSGIYWPPSAYEAAFMSLAHSEEDIQATIRASEGFFRSYKHEN